MAEPMDRTAVMAELYKRQKQGLLSDAQQAILGELTRRGAFPPLEGVTEPGLVDQPLFVPGSEVVSGALRHPAVLPTAGGVVAGPAGILGGEMLRQTLLPPSQQATDVAPDMPQVPGLTPMAKAVGGAITQPGILPGMATAGALRLMPTDPGIMNALGRTVAGSGAATTAEVARKGMTGEPITAGGVAADVALNLALQGVPEVGTEAARFLARHTMGGQRLLKEAAGARGHGIGQQVFAPPSDAEIAQQFALVRASGVQIQPYALRSYLTNLSPEEQQTILREVKAIGAGPGTASGLGGRLATVLDMVRQGQHAPGIDIADLQQLRSQLRQRVARLGDGARQDLLNDLKDAVDQAIDSGRVVGGQNAPQVVQLLHTARSNYALSRAAEDLNSLVLRHSDPTENLKAYTLKLAALKKDLDIEGSRLAQSVGRSLQRNPAATEALDAWLTETAKLYPNVTIQAAGGIVGIAQHALASGMLSDTGRQMLRGFLADGKGVLTANQLAVLDTLLSHERLLSQRQQR